MNFSSACTYDEWFKIALRHRTSAQILLASGSPDAAFVAYQEIGSAIESAFFAVISKRKGYNQWPSRSEARDLHGHRLRKIAKFGKIEPSRTDIELMAKFHAICDWSPDRRYQVGELSVQQVQRFYDDAFGKGGVFNWLRTI